MCGTKRSGKIILCLLAAVLLTAAGFAIWQRENLKALYTAARTDEAGLVEQLETQRQADQAALEEYGVTITPPTTQQTRDLLDGKTSAEDVKAALELPRPEAQAAVPAEPEPPAGSPAPEPEPEPTAPAPAPAPQPTPEELTNACVAELYACEVDLMGILGGMKQAALDEWHSLPAEERTAARKRAIGMAGLDACYDLEAQVDAQVEAILESYRQPLLDAGGDTAVLEELWAYYCHEKASTKAYYFRKYLY